MGMENQEYTVDLNRKPDGRKTVATTRTFSIELGSKSGDPSAGFNPAETLLAAAGGCITSSMGLVAANSGLRIDGFRVKVTGVRQAKPPKLVSIRYRISIDSPEDDDRIDKVFRIAERNSTVLSTLKAAVQVTGEWQRTSASDK